MHVIKLAVLVLLVPACLLSNGDELSGPPQPPPPPPDTTTPPPPPPPPPPPEPSETFRFDRADTRIGVGMTDTPAFHASAPLDHFDLASSDPAIVELEIAGEQLVLHPHAAGVAVITARVHGEAPVGQLVVDAVEVGAIELYFHAAPVAPEPLTSLAAVIGSDTVGIRYRDAGGAKLAGHGSYRTRGTAVQLGNAAESRISEIFEDFDRVQLRFGAIGSGELVVQLATGREQAFPIQVVAGPGTLSTVAMALRDGHLVVAPDPLAQNEPVGIDIVGRLADGRFVAGVVADWTLTGSPDVGGVSELLLITPKVSGPITATAKVGTRTVSRTLNVR